MSESLSEHPAPTSTPASTSPALWNPQAAALWSLLFSPVFGAWLHALNWRTLGDVERQRRSARWMMAGLAICVFYVIVGLAWDDPAISDRISSATALAYLLAWYLGPGREQIRAVRERHGPDYPRRAWGRVLGIAVLAWVGYLLLAALAGLLLGIAGG